MVRIQIYTTSSCPHCVRAKALLRNKSLDYDEIDVTDDEALRDRMTELAAGRRTVPQIFIDGKSIGGYAELKALDDAGELDQLLAQPA